MNKRTKAVSVSKHVQKAVLERDNNQCIFCHSTYQLTMAHRISRASGGKGIEQNLASACIVCHMKLDQSINRKKMLDFMEEYLVKHYGKLENIIYKKGE